MGVIGKEIEVKVKITSDLGRLEEVLDKLHRTQAELSNVGRAAKETSAGTETLGTSIGGLVTKFAAWLGGIALVRAALRGLGEFVSSSIDDAKKQQNANHGLADSLQVTGQNVEAVLPLLMRYAAELQHVTGIGDEVSIGIMERLTRFGLEGEALKRTTALILDMVASGKDEAGSVDLLGRAYKGQTQALTRYGLVIDENLKGQDKYNAVLDAAARLWGGKAAEAAQTYEGRVRKLNAVWGDFKESVGFAIIENPKLAAGIQFVTDKLEGQTNQTKKAEERTSELSKKVSSFVLNLAHAGKFLTNFAMGIEGAFLTVSFAIEELLSGILENLGGFGEKANNFWAGFFDKVPGGGKLAAAFREMARQSQDLKVTGQEWYKESNEGWDDYMKRLEHANDEWDRFIKKLEEAKTEQEKAASAKVVTPTKTGLSKEEAAAQEAAMKGLAGAYANVAKELSEAAKQELDFATGSKDIGQAMNFALAARRNLYNADLTQLQIARDKELAQENLTAKAKEDIQKRYGLQEAALRRRLDDDLLAIQKQANNKELKEAQTVRDRKEQYAKEEAENALKLKEWERKRSEKIRDLDLKDTRKMNLQDLIDHRNELQRELAAEKTNAERKKVIARDLAQTKIQLAIVAMQTYIGILAQEVDQSTAAGRTLFAISKTIAAGDALMHAFGAAAGAAAETHGDVYTRIAAYVAAFAEVYGAYKAIQGITMKDASGGGQGFDNPEHDAAARTGGFRWATDMVREWNFGISKGWAEALLRPPTMQSSVTHGPTHTYNGGGVHMHLQQRILTGAEAHYAAMDVAKRVDQGKRMLERRTPGVKVYKLGSRRDYTRRSR